MNSRLVYLAGPIAGCSDAECRVWREQAARMLRPLDVLDPLRRDYREQELFHPELAAAVVSSDKADIVRSAALLVHYDRPSIGTSMEIIFAWTFRIPVFVANQSGAKTLSPWLVHHAHEIHVGLEATIRALKHHVLRNPAGAPDPKENPP